MSEPILEVRDLSKTYSGITVLNQVEFKLEAGQVHALVGENGAGKSTLIKLIAGVEKPDEGGTIRIGDISMSKVDVATALKMGVTVIYQDISLFPNLSVAENICIELHKNHIIRKKEMQRMAGAIIEQLGLDLDLNAILGNISVGKQQLVAIARAVLFQSKIIIMDEPTAALSSSEVDTLYSIIRNLKALGVGIIYISHKLDEIFELADRISVLRDGNLVACGDVTDFDHQKLITLMVGRELRFIPMRNEEEPSEEVLLDVNDLSCTPYFKHVSFQLMKHEILGITGLVGAGRSELAQTIFRIRKTDGGEVKIMGKAMTAKTPMDVIQAGICYLPEDRRVQGLFYGQSMKQNITTATLQKYLGRLGLISEKKEIAAAHSYIKKINIRPIDPHIHVENMSGGNQQKALLSRWLDANPKVLIVDEPTSGIDVGAKLEIHRLLRELAKSGIGVILISSDLPEILAISDRILVMRHGKIVDEVCDTSTATQESVLEKGIMG